MRCEAPCATVLFNFTGPGQLDALVEVCTITFIILLMAVTSCDLQEVVDRNLVKPLEEKPTPLAPDLALCFGAFRAFCTHPKHRLE